MISEVVELAKGEIAPNCGTRLRASPGRVIVRHGLWVYIGGARDLDGDLPVASARMRLDADGFYKPIPFLPPAGHRVLEVGPPLHPGDIRASVFRLRVAGITVVANGIEVAHGGGTHFVPIGSLGSVHLAGGSGHDLLVPGDRVQVVSAEVKP